MSQTDLHNVHSPGYLKVAIDIRHSVVGYNDASWRTYIDLASSPTREKGMALEPAMGGQCQFKYGYDLNGQD